MWHLANKENAFARLPGEGKIFGLGPAFIVAIICVVMLIYFLQTDSAVDEKPSQPQSSIGTPWR